MTKYLLLRIVMSPDATVHVVLHDGNTFACTPNLLTKILSTPTVTSLKTGNYTMTTDTVNPLKLSVSKAPGLTLVRIYSDAEVICTFPQLFETLFSNIKEEADNPIDLKKYINGLRNCDEKQIFMKLFCHFINDIVPGASMSLSGKMTDEAKKAVLDEMINSAMIPTVLPPSDDISLHQESNSLSSATNKTNNQQLNETSSDTPSAAVTQEKLYTVKEAAKILGYSPSSRSGVYYLIRNNLINTVSKPDSKSKYYIPQSEIDRRLKEHPQEQNQEAPLIKQPENDSVIENLEEIIKTSSKGLQEELASFSGLSPQIIKYIKTKEQYKFFRDNGYKEVHWESRRALIIDVEPAHVSKKFKISNAERMSDGKAPVIPGTDFVFEIHHVDQELSSPFAIITYKNHKDLDGQLHKKRRKLKFVFDKFGDHYQEIEKIELHDKNFEYQKKKFWEEYIKVYEEAGCFEKIDGYSVELDKEKKQTISEGNK